MINSLSKKLFEERSNLNYLKEINFFYDWLDTNSISDSAIVLWHALMQICNRAGWITEFAVAIATLETKTRLKKDAILRARNTLQQYGRIRFRSRAGQQSAIYSIVPFDSEKTTQTAIQNNCVSKTDTNCNTNYNTNRAQCASQTASIIKLKETQCFDLKDPPLLSFKKLNSESGNKLDLLILEPIAVKLFGQSNHEILENLWSNIKEFKLDPEVIQECLTHVDAREIKFNPYGYFRGKYAVAIAIVTKRMQISDQQRQLEELIRKQEMLFTPTDTDCKSTNEVIAEIRKMLGITKNIDTKQSKNEPN